MSRALAPPGTPEPVVLELSALLPEVSGDEVGALGDELDVLGDVLGEVLGEVLAEPLGEPLGEVLGEGLGDVEPEGEGLSLALGLADALVGSGVGDADVSGVGNCCGAGDSESLCRPQAVTPASSAMASTAIAPHTRPADEVPPPLGGAGSSSAAMSSG